MPRINPTIRLSRLHVCALAVCSLLGTKPAAAALSSWDYPLAAAHTALGADFGGSSINLPNAGTPSITMNFVLPRDYQTNSQVNIVFYVTLSVGAPCKIRFIPTAMTRKRVGSVLVNDLNGLSSNSSVINIPVVNTVVQKQFILAPGGLLTGQNRGDAFSITFARDGENAQDTCAGNSFFVHGIEIRYTPTP